MCCSPTFAGSSYAGTSTAALAAAATVATVAKIIQYEAPSLQQQLTFAEDDVCFAFSCRICGARIGSLAARMVVRTEQCCIL